MRMLLLSGVLAGSLAAVQAPARPDFSGEWVLDPSRTTVTGAPMRLGGPGSAGMPVTPPKKIKNVNPRYPRDAQVAKITGIVMLEAIIDRQGKVKDLAVLRSVPGLDAAAMEAVSQWEYTPTLVAGAPVEIVMTVTVSFSLGTPPQMGAPVPPAPGGAVGSGLGRGFATPVIEIGQSADAMTLTRKAGTVSEDVRYRFDGREIRNKLTGAGGAVDGMYNYVSRWEGDRLVSSITWTGPRGPRQRTETIWTEGDVLRMQSSRPPAEPGGEPLVQTYVFTRRR